MPLRIPRFRLRTILIAMVLVGFALSRMKYVHSREGHVWNGIKFRGINRSGIQVMFKGAWFSHVSYFDRAGRFHHDLPLFSFDRCSCCGKSWQWDWKKGEYVEPRW